MVFGRGAVQGIFDRKGNAPIGGSLRRGNSAQAPGTALSYMRDSRKDIAQRFETLRRRRKARKERHEARRARRLAARLRLRHLLIAIILIAAGVAVFLARSFLPGS
jgi:hypothetical protein